MAPPRSKDRTTSYRRLDARRIARLHGYPSQSEGALRRAYRRRDKFATRWGWDVAKPLVRPRPKGRWCRSYVAALDRLAELEAAPLAGVAARLDRMTMTTGI